MLILVALLWASLGCGRGGPTRYDVSGTATFDGQPIPAGVIFFEPDVTKGNTGLQGYAEINDGSYNTARGNKGITGGEYLVRIRGFTAPAGGSPSPLFPEFHLRLDLPEESSTQDLVVPKSAADGETGQPFEPT